MDLYDLPLQERAEPETERPVIEVWAQLCPTSPTHITQLHALVLRKLVCSGPPQLFLTLAADLLLYS